MKIPERVKEILEERTEAARDFMALDYELVHWMEETGIDVNAPELRDHLFWGCESLVNPKVSAQEIIKFLQCWEEENEDL